LETSSGFSVVEVGTPAEHETLVDHEMTLPTTTVRTDRQWDSQRFVWHRAADATVRSWMPDGSSKDWTVRDSGIAAATQGAGGVVTVCAGSQPVIVTHNGDLWCAFALSGSWRLADAEATPESEHIAPITFGQHDTVALPPGRRFALSARPGDELLLVTVSHAGTDPRTASTPPS
jgi:hypothetical protein